MNLRFYKPKALACALAITVLFPPLAIYGGGRTIFKGFGFLFDGYATGYVTIHMPFLLVELAVIVFVFWLIGNANSEN